MLNHNKFLDAFCFRKKKGIVIYKKLGSAIETAIQTGDLKPGDKLPTQRAVAAHLGINLSTVAQAFKALRDKKLIISKTGSGSFIAPLWNQTSESDYPSAPIESGTLDMTVNRPATPAFLDALAPLLQQLPDDDRFSALQDYHPPNGALWARQAVADWLIRERTFKAVDCADLVITHGAQHALACVLQVLTKPGDVVLADAITYQGVMALCHTLRLTLRGVVMDGQGMSPEALDDICKAQRPAALILIPTLHNPTSITLTATRRSELAAIACRHNVTLIEDDVYRALYDSPAPTLYSMAPENTYYVGGFSKLVAPGLRVGFIMAPPGKSSHVATAVRINTWCVSPLSMLLMTKLLESGQISTILKTHKNDIRIRQDLVQHHIGKYDITTYPTSPHVWLRLPDCWITSRFITTVRTKGVSVLGSDMFAVEHKNVPHAVRLNIAALRSHKHLADALSIIAQTLGSSDGYRPGAF